MRQRHGWFRHIPRRGFRGDGRLGGAILSLDSNLNIQREAAFSGALITEVTFPKLDAGSKEAANLTLRFQPKFVEWRNGVGKLLLPAARQKPSLASSFRLQVDGLECSKVSAIDAITLKREVTPVSLRGAVKNLAAGKVEIPNLVVTLSSANASTWFDWHETALGAGA